GAYDTKQCRQVIADRQAHAVIPPRKNAKPWKDTKSSSLERNELLRTIIRLGRTLWKKWSGYDRRSLVETKMHCIKLLGDKLSARSFDSQVNEIHARVACSIRGALHFKSLCNKALKLYQLKIMLAKD
ncbi:transposase, partial [Acinetobacter guillouiae]|uniref:transposase n=1 Tax=Acinetobacter guillouiae TaxID=106649 RepID=UPI0022DF7F95